jgi:hypothetical protein
MPGKAVLNPFHSGLRVKVSFTEGPRKVFLPRLPRPLPLPLPLPFPLPRPSPFPLPFQLPFPLPLLPLPAGPGGPLLPVNRHDDVQITVKPPCTRHMRFGHEISAPHGKLVTYH